MYTIKLKTLFHSYPSSLHQSICTPQYQSLMLIMSPFSLLPHMFSLLFVFVCLHRPVVVVELPVADLLAPDLSGRLLNKAKDLLEFVGLRHFNLIQGRSHLVQPALRLDAGAV
jgi:hypothetical protein